MKVLQKDIIDQVYIKDQLNKFLESCIGEMITESNEQYIYSKKEEFLNWLKVNRLDYLLEMDKRAKTLFEWHCTIEILNILMNFDLYLEQHDRVFNKPIDFINKRLRESLEKFSSEFKDDNIIDEIYNEGLDLKVIKLKRLTDANRD